MNSVHNIQRFLVLVMGAYFDLELLNHGVSASAVGKNLRGSRARGPKGGPGIRLPKLDYMIEREQENARLAREAAAKRARQASIDRKLAQVHRTAVQARTGGTRPHRSQQEAAERNRKEAERSIRREAERIRQEAHQEADSIRQEAERIRQEAECIRREAKDIHETAQRTLQEAAEVLREAEEKASQTAEETVVLHGVEERSESSRTVRPIEADAVPTQKVEEETPKMVEGETQTRVETGTVGTQTDAETEEINVSKYGRYGNLHEWGVETLTCAGSQEFNFPLGMNAEAKTPALTIGMQMNAGEGAPATAEAVLAAEGTDDDKGLPVGNDEGARIEAAKAETRASFLIPMYERTAAKAELRASILYPMYERTAPEVVDAEGLIERALDAESE